MANDILKQVMEDGVKWAKSSEGREYAQEGRGLIHELLKQPELLLELARQIRNIPDLADEVVANNQTIKELDDSLKQLKLIKDGYVRQSKIQAQDGSSSKCDHDLIKKADSVIKALTERISGAVNELVEDRLNSIMNATLQHGVSMVNLSDRTIVIGNNKYKYSDYISKLLKYQILFYGYSNKMVDNVSEKYKALANDVEYYISELEAETNTITFKFKYNPRLPLQFVDEDIKKFAADIKLVASLFNELYSCNNISKIDFVASEAVDQNVFISDTFDRWDRYLRICELNKNAGDPIGKNLRPKIDTMCRVIAKEFSHFATSDIREQRKAIKADYACALQLIDRAEKGTLLT